MKGGQVGTPSCHVEDGSIFQPQMSARAAKLALDNVVKRSGSAWAGIHCQNGSANSVVHPFEILDDIHEMFAVDDNNNDYYIVSLLAYISISSLSAYMHYMSCK